MREQLDRITEMVRELDARHQAEREALIEREMKQIDDEQPKYTLSPETIEGLKRLQLSETGYVQLPTYKTESGASTSPCPAFHYIPLEALVRLARRYELGALRHGPFNFREALGQSVKALPANGVDQDWITSRWNHTLYHLLKYNAKRLGFLPDDGDDDLGAAIWGVSVMIAAERE